jgi:molybdopterin molybdotransferase
MRRRSRKYSTSAFAICSSPSAAAASDARMRRCSHSPSAVGRIGHTPVVVMPGAPDQALAVWWTLVLPGLDRLGAGQRKTVSRPLTRKIASSVGIAEIVLLEKQDGAWTPLAVGDLPLAPIAHSKAWLLVPGDSEGYAAGTPVNAYLLRE